MSDEAVTRVPARIPSSRRFLIAGAAVVVATGAIGLLPFGSAAETVSYVLFAAFMLVAAGVSLTVAMSLEAGSAVRRQWLTVGIGTSLGVIGDVVYLLQGTVTGSSPPFPSWAVPVYLLQYAFLLAGMSMAALAYRQVVPMGRPLAVALAVSVPVASLIVWLEATAVFEDVSMRSEAILFGVADTMLIFAPALFLMLVVGRLGASRLASPWRAVVAGALLFAFGDVANFAIGAFSGSVDIGVALVGVSRMGSAMLFAAAVLMAREAFEV